MRLAPKLDRGLKSEMEQFTKHVESSLNDQELKMKHAVTWQHSFGRTSFPHFAVW